jgi:lambda family phage portal protein
MISLGLRDATPMPRAVRKVRNSVATYEAGSQSRRTVGWRAPTVSANAAILGNLTTLRDRSRAATRNDGYAKGVIDKLVANIIGTGIKPLSQAKDPEFRKAVQALWLRWTDQSDADGQLDWYGQQAQAVRTWLEAGEGFGRIRLRLPIDGLCVPIQVQVLEPELCPHDYSVWSTTGPVRAGIEFDAIGRRVAYYFYPSRPELDDFDASQLRRVPADAVSHLYDPLRPGQLRGMPHLTQALVDLYELDKFDDAVLLRQQLANLFAGFITRPPSAGVAEDLHPLTGLPVAKSSDGKPMVSLEAGIMQELDEGEEVTWSDPPEAHGYPDFMRQQLSGIAAATGVPYEVLTGDMRGVNDRTVRVILNEFRGRVAAWQHHIVAFKFCRPVWRAWMDRVFLSGALPIPAEYLTDPEQWAAVKWTPPRVPYIQPVQDIEAQKAAIRSGLTSRAAVVSEYGEDAEAIDTEQAIDNARADGLGLKYDSDGRQTPKGTPAPAPAPVDPNAEPDPNAAQNAAA